MHAGIPAPCLNEKQFCRGWLLPSGGALWERGIQWIFPHICFLAVNQNYDGIAKAHFLGSD